MSHSYTLASFANFPNDLKTITLSSAFLLCISFAHAQNIQIQTSEASCHEICDGTATFNGLDLDSQDIYKWRTEDSDRYTKLESNRISDLCTGRYELKVKKWQTIDHRSSGGRADLEDGYVHVQSIRASTYGLRGIQLHFKFPVEFDDPDYYLNSYYSIDGGGEWVKAAYLYQSKRTSGDQLGYFLALPERLSNRSEILINIQQRTPKKRSGVPLLNLIDLELKGRNIENLIFDVGVKENMEIRSLVSNVTDTEDGYISTDVSGGQDPYTYNWSNGCTRAKATGLQEGSYSVTVRDQVGCEQVARFEVMDAESPQSGGRFTLTSSESQVFVMTISDLYRQPLQLILKNAKGHEVKTYRINPLYEDLKMNLDLSFLQRGNYTAHLKGTAFSDNVNFSIH